jgi:hypothetical protein
LLAASLSSEALVVTRADAAVGPPLGPE